ncbi:cilia- and flagella-associated protein 157 [Leptinotarsa decemlineata]|uniref:cilia- and flagella-associated protein 157 n=1 Tax=Leptinotarsa decemlineata TaxID=7539 RepID=UPI003D3096EC
MAKGKAKKGKKKKTVEVDPNALTEVDKTFYELTITDLNRKLVRLRSLTQELEQKNEEITAEKEKLDEDRADIIVYLKRMLQEKTDEIAELEERITALQETRQTETEKSEEKISEMETEYNQMHEQLTSENKLLEGKLNSLEEFRSQRDDLMKKFETQETLLETQEKRHKRELYEIERKFIISKDQLKKEMEARLLQLSTDFHDATELRIAATTHRVIRENITVNNELDVLLANQQRLYNENSSIKKRDTNLRQQCELLEQEKKKALGKVRVQLRIISRLTDDHKFMSDQLEKLKKYEVEVLNSRTENRKLNETILQLEYKVKVLEQNLHHVRCDRTSVETDFLYLKEENDRLSEVLMEAESCIKEALTVRTESDQSLKASKRENLLNSLFTLLNKAKKQKIRRPSLETVDLVEATYMRGDLGFVPKPVELRSTVPTKRHIDSQTGASFEEYLATGKIASFKNLYTEDGEEEVEEETERGIEEEVVEEEKESVLFFDETEVADEETDSAEFDIFQQHEESETSRSSGTVSASSTKDNTVSERSLKDITKKSLITAALSKVFSKKSVSKMEEVEDSSEGKSEASEEGK